MHICASYVIIIQSMEGGETEHMFLDCKKQITKKPNMDEFHMHAHDFYEIYCFLSGDAKYFVEGNIYKLRPGDILFIKKAEAHSLLINSPAPYERIVISFDAAALTDSEVQKVISFFDGLPLGSGNRFPYSMFNDRHWHYYIDKMLSYENNEKKGLYLSVLVNEMYECCFDILNIQTEKDDFSNIIAYLNTHLTDALTLDSICARFYISKSQLNRKFKRMTGSTVWEYITAKRLLMAKELLQGGEPPAKVFSECGFNDYTSFFRAYKAKFAAAPKNDFIKHKSRSDI